MNTIEIRLPSGSTYTKQYDESVRITDILSSLEEKPAYPILAVLVNNRYERLNASVDEDALIVCKDQRDSYANMSYQMSLSLLYCKAVHDVLGKDVRIEIANSLSKGLFTKVRASHFDDASAKEIESRMQELVDLDLPILQNGRDRDYMLQYLRRNDMKDQMRLFESAYDLNGALITMLEDEEMLCYQYLLPSTGYLKLFEVRRYHNGVLLRFPHPSAPDRVPPYEEQKLLYEAFSEETRWNNLMGIREAADLNEKVRANDCLDMVMLSEALHEKRIAEIAEMIHERKKRIILIAGPSSSGKTTFAKRLCVQLRVIGLKPLYLGTDDYFINRADLPVGPDGKKDFEDLSAVDTDLFASQMNDLLSGKKVDLPEYNFIEGKKEFGKRILSIDSTQPIVIEGIHGLNPKLTEGIAEEEKFRIYISPLTQLNIDSSHRIPTTDARMLRRLVRDYRTRGYSAQMTIDAWHDVRAGEEKNIFPYNGEADVFFNSQCLYELAVLKKYAEPLLKSISASEPEYPEARRMLQFLQFFVSMQDDSIIPNNSIIREFIGGSVVVS